MVGNPNKRIVKIKKLPTVAAKPIFDKNTRLRFANTGLRRVSANLEINVLLLTEALKFDKNVMFLQTTKQKNAINFTKLVIVLTVFDVNLFIA